MGLIKKAIVAGGIYAIANKGIKAYENHDNNQHQSQSQQQQCQQQPYQQQPRQYGPPAFREYPHQAYCNGQCGGRCNEGMAMQQSRGFSGGVTEKAPPAYSTR